MTCGCGGESGTKTTTPPERARDHAAMCEICPYAQRGEGISMARTAVWCRIAQDPVLVRITLEQCPARTFAEDGIVRWLGIEWYGVPMPVRWWLRLTHPKRPKIRGFSGCGCVKVLKDLWIRAGLVKAAQVS